LIPVNILDVLVLALVDSGTDISLCCLDIWKTATKVVSHAMLKPVKHVLWIDYTLEHGKIMCTGKGACR